MPISNMPITYVLTYVNENKDPFENFNFQIVIFKFSILKKNYLIF